MALRYRIPLPGPFYYSGLVGPKHWLSRDSLSDPPGWSAEEANSVAFP